jgi:hypothetical protein
MELAARMSAALWEHNAIESNCVQTMLLSCQLKEIMALAHSRLGLVVTPGALLAGRLHFPVQVSACKQVWPRFAHSLQSCMLQPGRASCS